jgi:uncharacterized protein (DUF2164 family)
MRIDLSDDKKREAIVQLQNLFRREFDEQLSDFRANLVLEVFLEKLCPVIYNQAVQDARSYLQRKLDDLDSEVYVDAEI